jgi:hypothetical protein
MQMRDGEGNPLPIDTMSAMLRRRWGDDLAQVRAGALAEIDAAAEVARGAFITRGAGQAMEYLATEAEARAFNAGAPGPFPFLAAERDALGNGVTLAQVAAEVLAQAGAWQVVGAAIKRTRRAGKLAVEAAATVEEVAAALAAIEWPQPGVAP